MFAALDRCFRHSSVLKDAPLAVRSLSFAKAVRSILDRVSESSIDRMPVILKLRDYQRWLEPEDPQRLLIDLPRSFPGRISGQ